jgi:hypothetical protein
MNLPRNTRLYATAAMWIMCDTASLGKKSSDARTTAACFELQVHSDKDHDQIHLRNNIWIDASN